MAAKPGRAADAEGGEEPLWKNTVRLWKLDTSEPPLAKDGGADSTG